MSKPSTNATRLVEIPAIDLDQWLTVGQRFDHVTGTVTAKLHSLLLYPCNQQLRQVAAAARHAATMVDQPLRAVIKLAGEWHARSAPTEV